ncbi:MAG: GNAT family N-acetyltransferase [Candidatus Limnocylindrales bacterium]
MRRSRPSGSSTPTIRSAAGSGTSSSRIRRTWVVVDGDEIVGMLSLRPGWVDHLYVAPDRRGEGIGRRLLDLAKLLLRRSARPVDLPGQQAGAAPSTEANGFVALELTDGAGNEEREPDVRYRWEPSI